MRVGVSELRVTANALLDMLEDDGVNVIDVPVDMYWDIPVSSRFNVYQDPTDFTIGQLEDDWREAKLIAQKDKGFIPYSIVWLSAVLRTAGEVASGIDVSVKSGLRG